MFQQTIPATYMRGGTSKGVFFRRDDLPADPTVRDRILPRVIGSPDPYGKHTDGMGGATSSTSKVVLLRPSSRPDCDVDYLYGAVAIEDAVIDWSGNCGNPSAAVGPFAIYQGWVRAEQAGTTPVRIWQENLGERIVAHVPVHEGRVIENGNLELDGVSFPAAEIRLDFLNPGAGDGMRPGGLFATGHSIDTLDVSGVEPVPATLIDAGNARIRPSSRLSANRCRHCSRGCDTRNAGFRVSARRHCYGAFRPSFRPTDGRRSGHVSRWAMDGRGRFHEPQR